MNRGSDGQGVENNSAESHNDFRLLSCGNDDLGSLKIIEQGGMIELTASSMAAPYLTPVLMMGGGIFLFGAIAWSDASSDLLSWRGLLFYSPVFITMWVMLWLVERYTRYRERKLLPLLKFEGSRLTTVRGREFFEESEAICLYLVHAFDSPQGEIVELQLRVEGPEGERYLVVSMLPGETQFRMKRHLLQIGKAQGINTYYVKTSGPMVQRPFKLKSIEALTVRATDG